MSRWWQHESLTVEHDQLVLDGASLAALTQQHGTPLFVYSRATILRQIGLLQSALAAATSDFQIFYAMKANRNPDVLATVQSAGAGVDTCSPREVALALQQGFPVQKISLNAGMLSSRDLATLAAQGIHCTLDSFSALRRYGALVPGGTHVGLRFNPGVRIGYAQGENLRYGNDKFGFEADELADALRAAETAGLVVDSVHMHLGWGLQEEGASQISAAFARLAALARGVPALTTVNVGGGLGGRYQAADVPLALSTWSALIHEHLAPLGVTIACEPGTFVVAPAGVLLLEINTVEQRRGIHWIGVDAGFAVDPLPALYNIPLEVVPLARPLAAPDYTYRVVGHINEVTDVWARSCALPEMRELDLLALFPAGAYGASMSSDHCLRGQPREVVV